MPAALCGATDRVDPAGMHWSRDCRRHLRHLRRLYLDYYNVAAHAPFLG